MLSENNENAEKLYKIVHEGLSKLDDSSLKSFVEMCQTYSETKLGEVLKVKTVKIPDTNNLVVFEFENKRSIICPAEGIWKAVQKYMEQDMVNAVKD